jgi:hypothetical protein
VLWRVIASKGTNPLLYVCYVGERPFAPLRLQHELHSSEVNSWSSCSHAMRNHLSRIAHFRAGICCAFHFPPATSGALCSVPYLLLRCRTTHFQRQTPLGSTPTICSVVCRGSVDILPTGHYRDNILRNFARTGPRRRLERHPDSRNFRMHHRCDRSVSQRSSSAKKQTNTAAFLS